VEYKDSVPRQLSHRLLCLDLSKLLIHLNMKYSEHDSYVIAKNFIDIAKAIAMKVDIDKFEITNRYGHLLNIQQQLTMLAEFYNLADWFSENVFIAISSNEFPTRGENKPGYQAGYFTGYQAQGSECPKIFTVGHRKGYRSNMTSNEFFYTANTRAKKVIINMCDERLMDGSLAQGGINYQTYKGITIEEKAANYLREQQGKVMSPDMEYTTDIMKKLTNLNRYKNGGKWWEEPKFSIKYLTNEV